MSTARMQRRSGVDVPIDLEDDRQNVFADCRRGKGGGEVLYPIEWPPPEGDMLADRAPCMNFHVF